MHSYLCFACFFISVSIASEADLRLSSSERLKRWRHENEKRQVIVSGNAHLYLSKSEDGEGEVALPTHLTLADSDVDHHLGKAVRLGDERDVVRRRCPR
jgi:hypothetical protein